MHELKGMASEELLVYCQMEYDILIEKSTKYISKPQEDVKTMEGQQKAIMLYLLKLSHENNHNMQKAQEVELQLRTLRS